MSDERCTRPPEGWWCSLNEGHDGPCPTHPYYGAPLEVVLAEYLSPEAIASVRAELEVLITPEMAAKQQAAVERIRERNARLRRWEARESTKPTAPAHDHLGRNCPPSCPAHGHQPSDPS